MGQVAGSKALHKLSDRTHLTDILNMTRNEKSDSDSEDSDDLLDPTVDEGWEDVVSILPQPYAKDCTVMAQSTLRRSY